MDELINSRLAMDVAVGPFDTRQDTVARLSS